MLRSCLNLPLILPPRRLVPVAPTVLSPRIFKEIFNVVKPLTLPGSAHVAALKSFGLESQDLYQGQQWKGTGACLFTSLAIARQMGSRFGDLFFAYSPDFTPYSGHAFLVLIPKNCNQKVIIDATLMQFSPSGMPYFPNLDPVILTELSLDRYPDPGVRKLLEGYKRCELGPISLLQTGQFQTYFNRSFPFQQWELWRSRFL